MVAIRCQAVDGREGGWACEVGFHRLATGGYGLRLSRSHQLPSGGLAARGRLPPSGDRWLRATGGYGPRERDIISTNPPNGRFLICFLTNGTKSNCEY